PARSREPFPSPHPSFRQPCLSSCFLSTSTKFSRRRTGDQLSYSFAYCLLPASPPTHTSVANGHACLVSAASALDALAAPVAGAGPRAQHLPRRGARLFCAGRARAAHGRARTAPGRCARRQAARHHCTRRSSALARLRTAGSRGAQGRHGRQCASRQGTVPRGGARASQCRRLRHGRRL
ncbi:hypothetical protein FA09DRAFT_306051, partial [Tilletiopsis washingtonensis]